MKPELILKFMNRKELIFLFAFILGCSQAFGQENYVDGYVVDLAGDTIQGQIDYQNWQLNPEKVNFKKQGSSSPSSYTPLHISSFYAAGEIYYSGIVQAEKSTQSTMKITKDRSFSFATDTAFLQALVMGQKSLFHYTDRAGRTNFYVSTDAGDFELLKFKMYLISHDGRLIKRRNKTYVSQLINYFGDCEAVGEELLEVEYTKRSLVKAFKTYYSCREKDKYYVHELPKPKLATRFLAGAGFTNLKNTPFAHSNNPVAGISFDFVFPRNFEKWSWNNDLLFTRYVAEDSYEESINGRNNLYEYEIELISFKLAHMARYAPPAEGARFFLNLGFVHGYSFVSQNYQKKTSTFGPSSYEEVGKAFLPDNEVSLGYLAGIGTLYNRLLLEGRFEQTKGLLGAFDSNAFYLLLGYRLNK